MSQFEELFRSIEPQVEDFFLRHLEKSKRWYPHEVVPWGKGRCFGELPWEESQCSLRPEVVVALETNLLTEDNLPYYHSYLDRVMDLGEVWRKWTRRWTAEEGAHASTIRDYLYLMRAMDPRRIEENRLMIMETGFDRAFENPVELVTYTAVQELATRVSHLRAGQKADEPIALELLSLISRDENFHYVFYRSVVKALLETAPSLVIPSIVKQLYSFEMPGAKMNEFELRQTMIADAGIFGTREYRDQVVKPILKYWAVERLTGLSPEAEMAQEKIAKLEKLLDRMVERQERRR